MGGFEVAVDVNQIDFDVALSFASEDRAYAEALAEILLARNYRVFYDKYEQAELWGKNLYEHLSRVYGQRARFCVMFISHHYRNKLWTKHEQRAAQDRAFREQQEYILPIRVDDTELIGVLDTVSYVDIRETSIEEIAHLLLKKLRDSSTIDGVELLSSLEGRQPTSEQSAQPPIDLDAGSAWLASPKPQVLIPSWLVSVERMVDREAYTEAKRELTTQFSAWPHHEQKVLDLLNLIKDGLERRRLFDEAFAVAGLTIQAGAPASEARAEQARLKEELAAAKARVEDLQEKVRDDLEKRRWDEAVEKLQEARKINPSDVSLYKQLSTIEGLRSAYTLVLAVGGAMEAKEWPKVQRLLDTARPRGIPWGLFSQLIKAEMSMSVETLSQTAAIANLRSSNLVPDTVFAERLDISSIPVRCVTFSSSGGDVFGSNGSVARTWPTAGHGAPGPFLVRASFLRRNSFAYGAFDLSGTWLTLVSSGGSIQVWSTFGQYRSTLTTGVGSSGLRNLSPALAGLVGIAVGSRIELWDVVGGTREYGGYAHPSSITSLAFAGDQREIALTSCLDGSVRLWDVPREEVLISRRATQTPVRVVSDGAGRTVAAQLKDGTVQCWPVIEDRSKEPVILARDAVHIDISRDGQLLAKIDSNGTLGLLDIRSRSTETTVDLKGRKAATVCFSSVGWTFAVGTTEGSVLIFEMKLRGS